MKSDLIIRRLLSESPPEFNDDDPELWKDVAPEPEPIEGWTSTSHENFFSYSLDLKLRGPVHVISRMHYTPENEFIYVDLACRIDNAPMSDFSNYAYCPAFKDVKAIGADILTAVFQAKNSDNPEHKIVELLGAVVEKLFRSATRKQPYSQVKL